MLKQDFRKAVLQARAELSSTKKFDLDYWVNFSLMDFCSQFNFEKILCFYPTHSEPNILNCLNKLKENGSQLYFTRVQAEASELEICPINDLEADFQTGSLKIMEPRKSIKAVAEDSFDLILVPGLAFSESCQRIGYGKGFYDKLLAKLKGLKVGIAFDFQIYKQLPTEKHDVNLDIVLTEKGTYKI
jgi:5-formyltetrahydrofolate cyclo-ligase